MLRHLRFFSTKSSSLSHEDFFRYTSGRWLHREQEQQSLRYRRFNVQALKDVAMRSVGADGVVSFRKLAEGRCNKVFHVEMTNGRRVVARIPTPLAGLPHIVTASEVATMRFLRDRLGLTQVPHVLAWSSKAEETDVGAEYIIMDVVDGVELHSVWHELSMKQKLRLVHQWVKLESKIVKSFRNGGGYGSLYFRKDIPAEDGRDVLLEDGKRDEEFVLGPSTLQTGYWEDLYGSSVELDRGPWPDVPSYLQSITNCERSWIRNYAKNPTREFVTPWEPPPRLQIPQDHLRLLDQYDSIAKFFIPSDERLLRPTFTLRDSNQGNIFLSREALARDGTIEISGIIDWQHTAILPLYLTSLIPRFIEQSQPSPAQSEKAFQKEQDYLRKAYHALYQETDIDVVWASALSFGSKFSMAQQLPGAAQFCWHGGYVRLKRQLVRAVEEWEAIVGPGVACPLKEGPLAFPQGEDYSMERVKEEEGMWMRMEDAREGLERQIGIESDGWVDLDSYERAVRVNDELRKAWVVSVAEKKVDLGGVDPAILWPYRPVESQAA